MALPVSGESMSSDTVSHDSTVANLIKFDARCECAMGEPVVATVMTCPAVAVTPNTKFKDVVNALLAGDAYAVPVVDTEARPLGTVTEADLLANLEFHGGTDAVPIFGGAAARRRWRKASALTAAELMAAPVAVIGADAPIGQAAHRLSDPSHLQLCVVDQDMRLVGILTRRNLLTVYRRSDERIEADVTAAIQADVRRPSRHHGARRPRRRHTPGNTHLPQQGRTRRIRRIARRRRRGHPQQAELRARRPHDHRPVNGPPVPAGSTSTASSNPSRYLRS